jgi:gas vesicle protein
MTSGQAPSREPDGSGCFLLGLLFGGLAGAVVALWKAPKSGVALRQQIAAQANALRHGATTRILGERIEDAVAEGKVLAQQRQSELSQDK